MLDNNLFPATKEGVLKHAEYLYLLQVLNTFKTGPAAYVADSYNYFAFLTEILPLAKQDIMSREGTLVVRGDSGDPVEIICGIVIPDYSAASTLQLAGSFAFKDNFEFTSADPLKSELEFIFKYHDKIYKTIYEIEFDSFNKVSDYNQISVKEHKLTPEEKGSIEILWDIFGGTVNDLGYKVLDTHIAMIYGDGITIPRATEIFNRLKNKGFASLNITFGIGAYSLGLLSRDDLGIAFKATAAMVEIIEGTQELVPVYKDPKTDSSKKSAKGLLKVTLDSKGIYNLQDNVTPEQEKEGELVEIYRDGTLLVDVSFNDIRQKLYS